MKDGSETSEYILTVFWTTKALAGFLLLIFVSAIDWRVGVILLPAVCVLIYMASVLVNNYSENRFRLKAQRAAEDKAEPTIRHIGFGRDLEIETEDELQEEEEEDDGD